MPKPSNNKIILLLSLTTIGLIALVAWASAGFIYIGGKCIYEGPLFSWNICHEKSTSQPNSISTATPTSYPTSYSKNDSETKFTKLAASSDYKDYSVLKGDNFKMLIMSNWGKNTDTADTIIFSTNSFDGFADNMILQKVSYGEGLVLTSSNCQTIGEKTVNISKSKYDEFKLIKSEIKQTGVDSYNSCELSFQMNLDGKDYQQLTRIISDSSAKSSYTLSITTRGANVEAVRKDFLKSMDSFVINN
jgi:hypothetical protein